MVPVPLDVVAIGDNITDCYLDDGLMFPGGNAVNVAVYAARAGRRSAYVGVVGDDARGRLLRESLLAEGVEVERLAVRPGPTAYALVRHVGGERIFTGMQRGVGLLHPEPDDLRFASRGQIAHSTYCSGMEEYLPALAEVTRVSFDFDAHLADDYARDLIPHVWVAEFSASGLSDGDCESLLRWAHAHGATYAIATRAAHGAMFFDGAAIAAVAAERLAPLDTLGAGDAFIGWALNGLLSAQAPAALLAASAEAAGQACLSLGGYGYGVPLQADLVTGTTPTGPGIPLDAAPASGFSC
jgi:fructoselysine 6-kinase